MAVTAAASFSRVTAIFVAVIVITNVMWMYQWQVNRSKCITSVAVIESNGVLSMLKLKNTGTAPQISSSTSSSPVNSTRHYKMVVGVLTAQRTPPTVVRMVDALVRDASSTDYKVLVRVSRSASHDRGMIQQLNSLGVTTLVNSQTYPEMAKDKVRITWNDPLTRVLWRTEHVLDYAYLLKRALEINSEYVLILEDDLKPAKKALEKSYEFAKHISESGKYSVNWGVTFYSGLCKKEFVTKAVKFTGGCSIMMAKSFIPHFLDHILKDPYALPVDLMMFNFFAKHKVTCYERSPNIFQHISPHSSYTAKDQSLRLTERARSPSFLYDEANLILSSLPVGKDGYIGCFKDRADDRDLSGMYGYLTDLVEFRRPSPMLCSKYCYEYRYYALQNGGECFCANEFGRYGPALESECNQRCASDNSKFCGGQYRNSVYKNLQRSCI